MAFARQRATWEPISSLLALGANSRTDILLALGAKIPKRRFKPEDFNPFRDRRIRSKPRGMPLTVGNLHSLKGMFKRGTINPGRPSR